MFFRKKKSAAPQQEVTRPHYLISDSRIITIVLDGQTHIVGPQHPNHQAVLDAIKDQRWADLDSLVDIPQAIQNYSEGNVTINEFGEVFYADEQVHSTVARRITSFFQEGLPFEPLVRFLERLMSNPSRRAVEELYTFLENEGMPLTEDGCFVGYKAVNEDYKDIHSKTFDNSPGQIHEMPRNLVDDDARRHCSNGFHIGSQAYAASFGGLNSRIMLVKVDPADAVSVPYDGGQKLRACKYEVLQEVDHTTLLQDSLYGNSQDNEENYDDDCYGWSLYDDDDED
jgi:hypothetical protein